MENDDILILLGLGYLALNYIGKPVGDALDDVKESIKPVWYHITGETHRSQGIYRVMGGPSGFKGSSTSWARFFPPIIEWGGLE